MDREPAGLFRGHFKGMKDGKSILHISDSPPIPFHEMHAKIVFFLGLIGSKSGTCNEFRMEFLKDGYEHRSF